MKDAYSFDLDAEARGTPTTGCSSPICAPSRAWGCKAIPMRADTGPIGGDLSHEFIILAETGESEVFCHARPDRRHAMPAPTDFDFDGDLERRYCGLDRASTPPPTRSTTRRGSSARCRSDKRVSARGIEVGHIFYFGTKYSEPMEAEVQGPDGKHDPVQMGSYGIGRLAPGRRRSSRPATTRPASSGRCRSRRSRSALIN